MKTLRALIFPFATLAFSAIAHAAPVQYQATGYFEVSAGPALFAYDTPIAMTFTYDSATLPSQINYPGATEMSSHAPLTYYTGAVTAFSSSVLDYSFSSEYVDGQVAKFMTAWDETFDFPVVFFTAGYFSDPSSPANSSLHGFSIGDSNLIGILGFAIFNSPSDAPPYQQLPEILSLSDGKIYSLHFDLIFKRPTDQYYSQQRFYIDNISAVPVPGAALFFLSGLAGLGATIFRKAKK